jgi:hypothetical protein
MCKASLDEIPFHGLRKAAFCLDEGCLRQFS